MSHLPAGKEASPGHSVHRYERHCPEQTLLYQFVEQYYPAFVDQLAAQGATLPEYVHGNSMITSSVAAWNTGSCVCAARTVTKSGWSRSVGRSCASLRPRH